MGRAVVCTILVACLVALAQAQDQDRARRDEERLFDHLRTGRYADARRLIDEMLRVEPRDDLKNVLAVFGSGPNMQIQRGSATFACEVSDTGVLLPLTVDGAPVTWLVDTDANVTMISDTEAARLGLTIRDSEGQASDHAGGSTGVRIATAARVVIGRTVLQDVPFLVTPADRMPWKALPPGKQGVLGSPVAMALDALRWTRDGMCSTGSDATASEPAGHVQNLAWRDLHIVVTAEFEGTPLEFILDTGNQAGTQLWPRFGDDFEPLIRRRGTRGTVRVTQIGGSSDRDVMVVPDVRLRVGGKDVRLARGNVFARPIGDDRFHGLLGMDVLSQAASVSIDFRSMTLMLR